MVVSEVFSWVWNVSAGGCVWGEVLQPLCTAITAAFATAAGSRSGGDRLVIVGRTMREMRTDNQLVECRLDLCAQYSAIILVTLLQPPHPLQRYFSNSFQS